MARSQYQPTISAAFSRVYGALSEGRARRAQARLFDVQTQLEEEMADIRRLEAQAAIEASQAATKTANRDLWLEPVVKLGDLAIRTGTLGLQRQQETRLGAMAESDIKTAEQSRQAVDVELKEQERKRKEREQARRNAEAEQARYFAKGLVAPMLDEAETSFGRNNIPFNDVDRKTLENLAMAEYMAASAQSGGFVADDQMGEILGKLNGVLTNRFVQGYSNQPGPGLLPVPWERPPVGWSVTGTAYPYSGPPPYVAPFGTPPGPTVAPLAPAAPGWFNRNGW